MLNKITNHEQCSVGVYKRRNGPHTGELYCIDTNCTHKSKHIKWLSARDIEILSVVFKVPSAPSRIENCEPKQDVQSKSFNKMLKRLKKGNEGMNKIKNASRINGDTGPMPFNIPPKTATSNKLTDMLRNLKEDKDED